MRTCLHVYRTRVELSLRMCVVGAEQYSRPTVQNSTVATEPGRRYTTPTAAASSRLVLEQVRHEPARVLAIEEQSVSVMWTRLCGWSCGRQGKQPAYSMRCVGDCMWSLVPGRLSINVTWASASDAVWTGAAKRCSRESELNPTVGRPQRWTAI